MTKRATHNKMNKNIQLLIIFINLKIFASANYQTSITDDPNDLKTLSSHDIDLNINYQKQQQENNSLIEAGNQLPLSLFNQTEILSSELDKLLDDKSQYSFSAKILLSTLAITTSLITISGNLLVMFAFLIDHQIRNPTNYFLLSLSISDFLIGVFSMPLYTLYLMLGRWPFGKIICNLWLSLDYTVCLTSIYTVLFITIDRFCSVKIPAKYRKWRSRNKIIWMIILTWVIPVFLFFPSTIMWSWGAEFDQYNCDVGWSSNVTFALTLNIGYFWTTLTVMIVLYCFIYQVAKNLEKRSRNKARKVNSVVSNRNNTGNKQVLNAQESSGVASSLIKAEAKTEATSKNDINTDRTKLNGVHQYTLLHMPDTLDKQKQPQDMILLTNGEFENKKDNKNPIYSSDKNCSYNTCSKTTNENSSDEFSTAIATTKISNYMELTDACEVDDDKEKLRHHASNTSKDDEFSSSFDSHSDYETSKKKHQQQAFKSAIKKVGSKINKKASAQNTINLNKNDSSITNGAASPLYSNQNEGIIQIEKDLQPRPETLAVLSVDSFAEKCTIRPIKLSLASTEIENKKVDQKSDPSQIPYIEDDFDEVSYILHRRQFGNREVNKQPISEQTIFIKNVGLSQKTEISLEADRSSQHPKNTKYGSLVNTETLTNSNENKKTKFKEEDNQNMLVEKNAEKLVNVKSDKFSFKTPLAAAEVQNHSAVKTADKTTLVTSTAPQSSINESKPKSKSKYENRARKALRTITVILGAFVFCWAPFHMVGIFDLFKNDICSSCDFANSTFYRHFYNTTYFLCYLNSPINPFCYALANQQFKKTFSRILKGDWRRT